MATSHRVPPEEKMVPLNDAATKHVNGRLTGHANGKLMASEKSSGNA
jgi:hypothetical protein